jgi:Tol biopolymer transport system component
VKKIKSIFYGLLAIVVFFLAPFSFSCAEAAQQIILKPGFNFISFTQTMTIGLAEFKSLSPAIEDIYLYNPAAGSFLSAGEGTLTSLGAGKGYIIKNSSAADITISVDGAALSTIGNISLKAGFNLAGFSKMPETVTFSQLMTRQPKIKGMYKWSAAAGTFIQVVRNASGVIEKLDTIDPAMKAAESYFINMAEELPLNYDGASLVVGTPPVEAKIAFVSNRNGKNEIFTMNASGTEQTKISAHSTGVHSPAISSDGAKVAYVLESSPGVYDVYVMNIDGTNVKPLTTDGLSSWPAWSSDGSKLAFSKSMAEVWTMNSDGSSQSKINITLTGFMDRLGQPCWSPDGTKILVTGFYPTSSNIYYINVASSTLHQLSYNVGMNMGPAFSPDGTKIVFGCNRSVEMGSVYTIYVMDSNGSSQQELSSGSIDSFSAKYSWSPDGSKIAFAESRAGDSNYIQVYVMNSDGTGRKRLTDPADKDNITPSFAAPSR